MKVIDLIMLLMLLGLIGIGLYVLWMNLPSQTIYYKEVENKFFSNTSLKKTFQFYPNMRFKSKDISFSMEETCDEKKRSNIYEALSIISEKTILNFKKDDSSPQIDFLCSEIDPLPEHKNYFVAGEGGPVEIINTSQYYVILEGKVSLYRDETCKTPHIAVHEIFHALGFDHVNNRMSIMYPVTDCEQEIDQFIIDEIKKLYSENPLPDLAISESQANKSGPYLSFSVTVTNEGLEDAENVSLLISANNKEIKSFDLDNLKIGVKKFFVVKNLRIPRDSNNLVIEVKSNSPEELSEENNKVILTTN
ncbi:matrixin family metalloprotease [Candidatus Pacearchaeota archaeon]|nr:matrixin family metalloprotease [Candidatus Pacearchaeota archaeon]